MGAKRQRTELIIAAIIAVGLVVGIALKSALDLIHALTARGDDGELSFADVFVPDKTTDAVVPRFTMTFPRHFLFLIDDNQFEAVDYRVLPGLAGRWGRLTLERKDGLTTDRETKRQRLRDAFEANDWQVETEWTVVRETGSPLFESRAEELSDDDLIYSHLDDLEDPESFFHYCRVFVSDDGSRVVAYCEMVW